MLARHSALPSTTGKRRGRRKTTLYLLGCCLVGWHAHRFAGAFIINPRGLHACRPSSGPAAELAWDYGVGAGAEHARYAAAFDGAEGQQPTSSTSASISKFINVSSAGSNITPSSSVSPMGASRMKDPPPSVARPPADPSLGSGLRKSDRAIFRKIVASQRTAALAGVDTQDVIWNEMRKDAEMECRKEPLLVSYMTAAIINHKALEHAVAFNMAAKLATPSLIGTQIQALFKQCFEEDPSFRRSIRLDIAAVMDRDPACRSYLDALLYFKGFQALQTHRVAHWLWKNGRDTLAFYLQSQVNKLFQIDIHPAARIGEGVFIDHGTGIVVGETAVIGHNVSMLHMVTLGGSGRKHVDRHPKIGDGVLLGAGSTILGNVRVGAGSLVGACSLVLEDIPPNSVAVGVPAKIVGSVTDVVPGQSMRQDVVVIAEDTPDYVI